MNRIFVDADACPVKDEALRVAQRHGWPIVYVSNSWMRLPEGDNVEGDVPNFVEKAKAGVAG